MMLFKYLHGNTFQNDFRIIFKSTKEAELFKKRFRKAQSQSLTSLFFQSIEVKQEEEEEMPGLENQGK